MDEMGSWKVREIKPMNGWSSGPSLVVFGSRLWLTKTERELRPERVFSPAEQTSQPCLRMLQFRSLQLAADEILAESPVVGLSQLTSPLAVEGIYPPPLTSDLVTNCLQRMLLKPVCL